LISNQPHAIIVRHVTRECPWHQHFLGQIDSVLFESFHLSWLVDYKKCWNFWKYSCYWLFLDWSTVKNVGPSESNHAIDFAILMRLRDMSAIHEGYVVHLVEKTVG